MQILDSSVSVIARRIIESRLRSPSVARLAPLRAIAADTAWQAVRGEAGSLREALRAGDPAARRSLADLAERAITTMRAEMRAEAVRRGMVDRIAADLDARFADTLEAEWMDDPAFDPIARVRVLGHLDHLNTMVGSYVAFFDALRPLLRTDGVPTRVLDLASGHGGFALAVARIARQEGIALEIRATDLKPEYLALGEARARTEGLAASFAVQDALDLSNLEEGAFDIVVCTQSLHHFPAGLVAVLASEASRIAARGVVLIDGYRSRTHAALIGSLGLLRFGDVVFAHDTWVSFRRFFAPEELGLLARLGPNGVSAEARWAPPVHCVVVIPAER
ncbi:MAG: methyltransferase domain-containing protein [Myxococcota bacterium]|nr:methyltransferase domain-containing protein [Myxococcota bacterium]